MASLAYLAYFYAVVLGQAVSGADGSTARNVAINAAWFAFFALHHSLFARDRIKARLERVMPPELIRSLYVWVASGLLVCVCVFWRPIPGHLFRVTGVAQWLLHALQVAGLLLVIGAARALGPQALAGIRQATSDRRDTVKAVGPFRVIRHPIYLGWMLMVWAVPNMTANRLLFAAISSAYLLLAIPWEERSLIAAHGEEYRVYQRTVRWRIIPGVW